MLDRLIKAIIIAGASTFVERRILPETGLGFLSLPSPPRPGTTPLNSASFLPCGYGLVIVIVAYTYLWLMLTGFTVTGARTRYSELAEKDGEKDVEQRYKLPNLYAQGTSKHAKAFNCVQRSHQNILETFPGYVCTVLFVGLEYPVTSSVLALLWLYSRMVWVKSYAASAGDAAKRYDHPFSAFFWHAMMALIIASWLVAAELLLGYKLF
mmetsp:Transcript_15481/g.35451  ORF Transcript_15481/g.35451 Transcript_15481/m.35451 type:complete len:210 (+) Transcript_15481:453-1082(+)